MVVKDAYLLQVRVVNNLADLWAVVRSGHLRTLCLRMSKDRLEQEGVMTAAVAMTWTNHNEEQ